MAKWFTDELFNSITESFLAEPMSLIETYPLLLIFRKHHPYKVWEFNEILPQLIAVSYVCTEGQTPAKGSRIENDAIQNCTRWVSWH